MKIAFISDIHGNAIALDAVLADIEKKKADKIVVLGDLVYRGPEPKRSLDLVKALDATVVKGNADEWVVRGVKNGEVPDQAIDLMNQERDWTLSKLNEVDIQYLANLPKEITFQEEGIDFHAFHATPTSLFDVVLPDASEEKIQTTLMSAENADVYLYGHIHKSYIRIIDGKTVVNLGSVGLPFDGVTKASYAMVEVSNGNVSTSIEKVAYDINQSVNMYEKVDYPNKVMMSTIVREAKN